ncbi:MAG: TPM domain-containing protein [Prolixibacteraceae bacterium]
MKQILLTIFLSLILFSGFSQDIPERPDPPRLVNDLAGVFSDQEKQQLETELVQFNDQTSTQITVVTVPSLNGYEISDFSFQLGEKWGVGQKGKDNGIVIVFKPKIANERGQVFIAIGYGLEGIIPDAIANREVVDTEMIPRFKQNDIFGGIYAGTHVLMSLAAKEYSAADYQKKAEKGKSSDPGGAFILVILIVIVLISLFKGGRGRNYHSGGSLPFWLAMGLLSGSNRGSGSFGDFRGGGGSFGGGGGFGGGSFGGGGAGGSW